MNNSFANEVSVVCLSRKESRRVTIKGKFSKLKSSNFACTIFDFPLSDVFIFAHVRRKPLSKQSEARDFEIQ